MNAVITQEVDHFCSLVRRGLEAWAQAGKLLVALVNRNSHIFEAIIKREPQLSIETLRIFERIGRGEIHPPLLLDGSIGAQKLLTLPVGEQIRLHGAEITVAILKGKEVITATRRINQLTRSEAVVAFSGTTVRPIKEQMALVRQRLMPVEDSGGISRGNAGHCATETVAGLIDDTPAGQLAVAQSAMLRVRELLAPAHLDDLDNFVTVALRAIGKLRFELKDATEDAE